MARRDRSAACPARAWGRVLGFAVAALAGCGSSGSHPDAGAPEGPAMWQPRPGDVPDWDIQLAMPFDLSAPRTMYDLDLWELVPVQTTIDYGDGAPVTVPAGKLAGAIAQLHARTPPAIVICYVETGMLDLQRPDAKKFPGFKEDHKQIPDNPAAPASGAVKGDPEPGSVIGWSAGNADLRFLDVRQTSRANVDRFLFKRFDLAQQIGCDGIDPAHNDSASYDVAEVAPPGFPIGSDDSLGWYAEVAKQGHARHLSTGMRNGTFLPGQADKGAQQFDWLIVERCGEFEAGGSQGCDTVRPFFTAQKEVFAIEYSVAQDGKTPQDAPTVCAPQMTETIPDGIFKNMPPPSSAVRTQCKTAMAPPPPP